MGEQLLRGVTMLDAYCQTCNVRSPHYFHLQSPILQGILMEDRNGRRSCIQCEICAERVREGSKKIAEIELGTVFLFEED